MCIRKTRLWGTERCHREFINDTLNDFCPPAWDNFLCWPPTAPGNFSFLPCPPMKGNDVSKFAFRRCLENGTWSQRPGSDVESANGWTNYSLCFNPYVKEFMKKVQGTRGNLSVNEYQMKLNIAEANRNLEMVGLTLSIVSLLMSLVIFYRFRNLQNNRTQIHKNLFIAMSIQVTVRLTVYTDQYLAKISNSEFYTIDTTKYACEASYILLEYARTAMFLWMLNEGLYLHNMITVAIFHERFNLITYYTIGWGFPVLLVMIWSVLTYHTFYGYVCWWGYNLSGLFWVLEGPRLLVIVLNFLFLLNIIRVLVTKLRESNSTEAQQVRRAARAAIVLLPLLGITNAIQMLHSPVDKNIVQFAIWSYVTTFLSSFQGFFCALIYCFLNGEVQLSLKRFIRARNHRVDTQKSNPGFGVESGIIKNQNLDDDYNSIVDQDHQTQLRLDNDSLKLEKQYGHLNKTQGGNRKRKSVEGMDESRKEIEIHPFFQQWGDDNHVDVEQIQIPLEYFTQPRKKITVKAATANPIKRAFTISPTDFQLTLPTRIVHQVAISSLSASAMTVINGNDNGNGSGGVQSPGKVSTMLDQIPD